MCSLLELNRLLKLRHKKCSLFSNDVKGSFVKAYCIESGADKIVVSPGTKGMILASFHYITSGVVVIYTQLSGI